MFYMLPGYCFHTIHQHFYFPNPTVQLKKNTTELVVFFYFDLFVVFLFLVVDFRTFIIRAVLVLAKTFGIQLFAAERATLCECHNHSPASAG